MFSEASSPVESAAERVSVKLGSHAEEDRYRKLQPGLAAAKIFTAVKGVCKS